LRDDGGGRPKTAPTWRVTSKLTALCHGSRPFRCEPRPGYLAIGADSVDNRFYRPTRAPPKGAALAWPHEGRRTRVPPGEAGDRT